MPATSRRSPKCIPSKCCSPMPPAYPLSPGRLFAPICAAASRGRTGAGSYAGTMAGTAPSREARTGIRSAVLRTGAALAVAAAALAGCSSDGGTPQSQWTAGTGAAEGPTSTAAPGATQPAGWKVFTDPAKTVSFEVQQDWIVQSVPPDPGALPGALKIDIKDAKGLYLATLQTGLPPQPAAVCADGAARDYVVLSSVPVDLPHGGGEGTIDP